MRSWKGCGGASPPGPKPSPCSERPPPSTSAADGGTTCSWDYVHSDGKGSTAIMTILKFGRDDTLQTKLVSQSSSRRP